MRQQIAAWFLLGAMLLAGCAKKVLPEPARVADAFAGAAEANGTAETVASAQEEASVLRALIVDGAETGVLVLAGEQGVYDVYTLDAASAAVTLDGKAADACALEDGMTIELTLAAASAGAPAPDGASVPPIALTGAVKTIAAHSLGTQENPGGTTYDLCGLYLRVLDDLWETDAGLNGGAKYVSVDLAAAPEEPGSAARFAVAWIFAQKHGLEPLTLSYDELIEQGYLSSAAPEGADWTAYQWDDGVLLRITGAEWAEGEAYSLPVVKFNAEKWRSPLGAYCFADCTAAWPEMGTWSDYRVGGEMIA